MSRKADFNAEEWASVVSAPLYAGLRLISAERGGTLRESLAMGRVYQEARAAHGHSELLDELVNSPPAMDPAHLSEAGDRVADLVAERIRDAMRILEAKADRREIDDYKRFVMTVAQEVAAAHREGGFLGIGSRPVSDAENQALDEISTALGSPPTS